ncbi:DUF4142 domain-containing protein [Asticcacaulis sp. BYS171W]|uniref:DUF4142 domain-containing protein n=1 Tax=Asticcacaulis aquaticus TaxID=2984212 RepID=A0ABT5HQB2_9CAUL|nr:DUF4142 domain-containing protein [Asticcacaulis aquaticus]MDC7682260.1 DUF4142 domain-containing protein [Asticcacaulis aquaticus]
MILKKTLLTASLAGFLAVAACSSPKEEAAEEASESASESVTSVYDSASSSASENVDFAGRATVAGLFEIESSKLAIERTKNADLKAFAQRMVTDQTKAATELKTAITAAGLTPPKEGLDEEHANLLNDLKNAKPEEFDAKYIDAQQKAHDKTVDLFEKESKDGQAGPVKDFATKTMPTLQSHHDAIKAIDEKY